MCPSNYNHFWDTARYWSKIVNFYRAMRCISAVFAHLVSVCLSVTFVDHIKTNKHIFEIFSPSGSDTILDFPSQRGCRYSDGNPLTGGQMQVGYRQKSRFWSIEDCWTCKVPKTFTDDEAEYMTQSATHHWLSIDYWTCEQKWQKQLPTTMQCRSHNRRRTIECLFVMACSMDQYAEKRTEKNLIVRSGILKPKKLIIKDCARCFVLKLYRHEASRSLFATAELLVSYPPCIQRPR